MGTPRRDPGRELARRRVGRGWSQGVLVARMREAALARDQRVGLNAEMISRWENGHRRPQAFYRRLIEELLGLPPECWEEGQEDVERREFLGTVGAAAAAGVAAPGETLSRLLGITAPSMVDTERLEAWRAEIEDLHATYEATVPEDLLGPVAQRLQQVTALLREPQSPTVRQRLSRLGAELAGLRGRLAFHLDESETTELWYRVALSLAEEAGEQLLAGWILGSRSKVALYGQEYDRAVALVQRGLALTRGSPFSPTRAWLLAMAARAHAGLGQRSRARDALHRAERARGAPAAGERRCPMHFEGDELLLVYHRAVTLKLLGELGPAGRILDDKLAEHPDPDAPSAAVEWLQKADILCRRGDPDAAAGVATRALEVLPAGEVTGPLRIRLSRLRRDLRPWRDAAAVRRLEEAWVAVGA